MLCIGSDGGNNDTGNVQPLTLSPAFAGEGIEVLMQSTRSFSD